MSLPPLSKVRCCHPKKFGRLPEGLLYTHQPLHPHNHCKRTIIPRSAPCPCLPSKKGRWHGCRGFSACCTVFRWSCFYDSETIPSRDGGDCSLSAPSMRFSALSPALNLPPLSKVRCCHPKKFGRLPEGLSLHQPSQTLTIPRKSPPPSPP